MTESVIAELRVQNDLLTSKLAQLGQVTRGLASELAAARRTSKQTQKQIARLRAENARLLAVRVRRPH